MALDGAFLCRLRTELEHALLTARVDKIHQPSREELVVFLRSREGTHKLYMSLRTASARVCLIQKTPENPASPPMFCMLLRKKLTGGRLTAIRQSGLERVLHFDFDCISELGDPITLTLTAECMGRYSNVILLDENSRVIDAMRRVDLSMSPDRPLLPGIAYIPPLTQEGRLDLSAVSADAFVKALYRSPDRPLSEALLGLSHGLSPLLCRELSHGAAGDADPAVSALTESQRERLLRQLTALKAAIADGIGACPYLLTRPDGTPLAYSFLPLRQYGLAARGQEVDSYSVLLERFYNEKDTAERMRQLTHDTRRLITTARDRIARRLAHQRQEQQQAVDREQLRIRADLINASLSLIPPGADKATLVNYYDPACATVTVPLDPALSPAANARRYYKEYRKAQRAETVLLEQIERGEQEQSYLDSVLDALSRVGSVRELTDLRRELAESGYLKLPASRQKQPAPLGPLTFRSDDGYTILVGRNNLQNDQLTLKTARPRDLWFHTKGIHGSHVIVLTEGNTPPDRTLEQAAMLAALHSKAAASAQVPVDYTAVKNVKKPAGAKPGKVIYEVYQTAYVTPDAALAERLRLSEK